MKKQTTEAEIIEEPAIPKKIFRAVLDIHSVYFGVEEVAALSATDVEVEAECDLPVGKYKWVAEMSQFQPLPKAQQTTTPNAPMADKALYALIKAFPNPPQYCVDWCAWYDKTLDGGK